MPLNSLPGWAFSGLSPRFPKKCPFSGFERFGRVFARREDGSLESGVADAQGFLLGSGFLSGSQVWERLSGHMQRNTGAATGPGFPILLTVFAAAATLLLVPLQLHHRHFS